jgi:ABC-type transport system substrate-binding protein
LATTLASGLILSSLSGASAIQARTVAATDSTVRIAYTSNLATMDPEQAYTDDWWLINGTIFNGLYQFDRFGKPQLNLAAAPPVISNGRKTWTFKIVPNARFSNGAPVTADDFVYTITRTLDPHLKPAQSWGQGSDTIIQGAADFVAGKAKSVSGLVALDSHTLQITLTQPFDLLPYPLASTYNMVIPRAVVSKETADQAANKPIGAGPYMLQSWQRGNQAVFVKNPYYFRSDRPKIAKIIAYENVPSSLVALKVQKGELDGYGNDQEIASPDLQQLQSDPKYGKFLTEAPAASVVWLDLNVHVAPLDNLKLRQAIAMAIDRRRLVQLLGGNAIVANQMYIPLDPQHDAKIDAQPPYTYDPQKAAALVKQSGYSNKPITLLFGTDASYYSKMAPGIQQQLQQIGLNVTLRGVSTTSLLALGAPLTGHQASFGLWSMDYPDGYDIYAGAMSCLANAAGGTIAGHYCDPAADTLYNRSSILPLGAARNTLLQQAQARVLQAAVHIPLVFLKSIEVVSPRVKNYYYMPTFGWQFENYAL